MSSAPTIAIETFANCGSITFCRVFFSTSWARAFTGPPRTTRTLTSTTHRITSLSGSTSDFLDPCVYHARYESDCNDFQPINAHFVFAAGALALFWRERPAAF